MPTLRDARRSSAVATCVPVNATLGVPGLPQSGTGQTTLLTGINAPRTIGKHFGPHPYSTLKPILEKDNLFKRTGGNNASSLYVNAFPAPYFRHIADHPGRITAITMAWLSTSRPPNDVDALREGRALSADITNERWRALGHPEISSISPEEAGRKLARIAQSYRFVLFEYFLTDHAGHAQSMAEAHRVLGSFDRMLGGLLDAVDTRSTLIAITSDHGNLEDLSTKSHTRNPVPLIAIGAGHKRMAGSVKNLTHIAPAILAALA